MMKKWLLPIIFLFPILVFGQKIYDAALSSEELLEPAEQGRRTSFRVRFNEEGLIFLIRAEGAKANIEIFFRTDSTLPDRAYHQFYTEMNGLPASLKEKHFPALEHLGVRPRKEMSFLPHYYYFGPSLKNFPYIGNYVSSVKQISGGYEAELFIPWFSLQNALPFDETGKGATWDFTILRSEKEPLLSWQGTFHKPATWGRLRFPDLKEPELKKIYVSFIRQSAEGFLPPPAFLFDRGCYAAAFEKMKAALAAHAAAADERLSVGELKSLADQCIRDSHGRRILTYLPAARKEKDGALPTGWSRTEDSARAEISYTFQGGTDGALVLQTLMFRPQGNCENSIEWETFGKVPAKGVIENSGSFSPAVTAPEGADGIRFTFKGKKGKLPRFLFGATLFEYRFGFRPLTEPVSVTGSAPLREDATICYHTLARNVSQQLKMLLEEPTFIMGGNGLLDGLDPLPIYKTRVCKDGPAGDMGMVGTNVSNHLWRLRNISYGGFPVKTFVLYMPSSNAAPAVQAEETRKAITAVRAQLPEAKIVLVGEIPNKRLKGSFRDSATFATNIEIKKLADGKRIVFVDPSASFMNDDGTVRQELWGPVFLTEEGYNLWLDAVLPLIDR